MFAKFKYDQIPLSLIRLDDRNPRIVTAMKLPTEEAILEYFFEHESLEAFLKKIASEGRNRGAERPYLVKNGKEYVVIEGNTRIAAYKLLTGLLTPPPEYADAVPHIPTPMKESLLSVECSIAPSRDALLPIMASAHFGTGDKSKWGYLGSRKAVYDEWKSGRSIAQLAIAFDRKQPIIKDLLVEYELYLSALLLDWTADEKAALVDPGVEFNPPVRFLQTSGHKNLTGIALDRVNTKIDFQEPDSLAKFKHLVRKLVVSPEKGLGATASYNEVFNDFKPLPEPAAPPTEDKGPNPGGTAPSSTDQGTGSSGQDKPATEPQAVGPKLKPGALFGYAVTSNNQVLVQLMSEAKDLNTQKFPGAGTALMRAIMEGILKHIIDDQGANPANKMLSLEDALGIAASKSITLPADDKKILQEFRKSHLDYVNLSSHATSIPNYLRLKSVRDCVDQFVKRNV
jgi:hypothetical protein